MAELFFFSFEILQRFQGQEAVSTEILEDFEAV